MKRIHFFVLLSFLFACQSSKMSTKSAATASVELRSQPENKRVEVWMDGKFFTAYIYPDNVAKPVLYPIITTSGKKLTRGFPLEPKAGERADHPHHIGYWLNYGDVNGLDFWNNSEARSPEQAYKYGTIYHQEILNTVSGKDKGILEVTTAWKDYTGEQLLSEETEFIFSQEGNTRIIDRVTTLKAVEGDVLFEDNKEGMVAIRVTRALELPEKKPAYLIGTDGKKTSEKIVDNTGVNGNYLSSEGLEGGEVWGNRARWMKLYSEMEGEKVALAIIDHPKNPGYPTYWHARKYGLFAANPLGQNIFSKGKEELNFILNMGESVTFRYRLVVHNGDGLEKAELDEMADEFGK